MNYSINLSSHEISFLLKAIEQITRLGVWNDEIDNLNKKLSSLLTK